MGNPPWERVKLQEQEFFAQRDAAIATAPNAAKRKAMITKLVDENPALHEEFLAEKRKAEGESSFLRLSGRYPLTGRGDVNTYSVFAETFRTIIRPDGRMGIITPTGLATDATTAAFFSDTLRSERLAAFYDFDNEAKIFPNVHHAFRFAVTSMTGGQTVNRPNFSFLTRHVADANLRQFALAAEELLLLNPNTGTLPLFRSRRDAEITLGVYRRHPVLIREGDPKGNPWGLSFATLFHMANDSGLFREAEALWLRGLELDDWAWVHPEDGETWLPLYEAKMLNHFDHRYSTYKDATEAQLRIQTLPRLDDIDHGNPYEEALARYWVSEEDVERAIGDRWDREWLLGWRDIARASDARTLVPSALPRAAVGHVFPIVLLADWRHGPLLQAVWSSFACDYVTRQKVSGTHLTYGMLNQIAVPEPSTFDQPAPWQPDITLAQYITPRVVELVYTSHKMAPFARDFGYDGPPFPWDPDRRALLKAELDAAMFHIYGLTRDEVEHVLDSFPVVRKYDERDFGEYRTATHIVAALDTLMSRVDHCSSTNPERMEDGTCS